MARNQPRVKQSETRNIICRNISDKLATELDQYKKNHAIKTDSGAARNMIKTINILIAENAQLQNDKEEITAVFNGQRKILSAIQTSLKFLEIQV